MLVPDPPPAILTPSRVLHPWAAVEGPQGYAFTSFERRTPGAHWQPPWAGTIHRTMVQNTGGRRVLPRFHSESATGRMVTLRVNTTNLIIILAMGTTGTIQEPIIIYRAVWAAGLRLWSPIDRPRPLVMVPWARPPRPRAAVVYTASPMATTAPGRLQPIPWGKSRTIGGTAVGSDDPRGGSSCAAILPVALFL